MEGCVGHQFFRLKLEKAARDRQKSYTDNRRKPLEFEVGPFEILEKSGPIAYRLRLPQELSNVHDTFYVLNLKKCLADANLHVPLEEIKVDKTLSFVEERVEIMDREVKKLTRSRIPSVKDKIFLSEGYCDTRDQTRKTDIQEKEQNHRQTNTSTGSGKGQIISSIKKKRRKYNLRG
ncbi:hypothetical protein Tco_0723406 [Tanacetum coccineum]